MSQPIESSATCSTCPFYCGFPGYSPQPECRAEPPKLLPAPGPQGVIFIAKYPAVDPGQWCGRHPERARAALRAGVIGS